MSDSKAIKAGMGYTVGNYLLKGLAFITVPIFARLLSQEDFGIYSTFVAYETILFIILGCAIHSSYKNAKYRYDIRHEESFPGLSYTGYISATTQMMIVNTLVLLAVVNIFSKPAGSLLGLDRISLNLLVLYSFSTAVLSCFNADASLRYSYKSYLTVAAINAFGNLGLSVLLILTIFNLQRYMGRILGTVIPMLVIAIVISIRFLKRERPKHQAVYLKWGLSFSIPIVFHGLSQVILSQFDRIMIRNMNGDAAAGIYSFGYTIFSIINVTFNSLDSVWETWFYEQMNGKRLQRVRKYASVYICGILLLCILLMLVCPEAIIILGSKKYIEAKYCTIPIVASGFFAFLYTLPASVEYYHEKTKSIAGATMIAAVVNIVLNYIFIKQYGYIAAAYTTLFTYILYFIFHYFLARRIQGKFIFSNKIVLLSSIVLLAVMFGTLQILDYPVLRWVIAIIIFVVAVLYEERRYHFGRKIIRRYIRRS